MGTFMSACGQFFMSADSQGFPLAVSAAAAV
jgi:hypothetical protein